MKPFIGPLFLSIVLTYLVGYNKGYNQGRAAQHCTELPTQQEQKDCWFNLTGSRGE